MAEKISQSELLNLYSELRAQHALRNAEYESARLRYKGQHWDAVTNPVPKNRYSLTLNYLKPFVDKSVQLLVGRPMNIQVMPSGTDDLARRHAEQLESVLYGTWDSNAAADVFRKTAWDMFTLRRGLVYVWWDPSRQMVRFKNCTPDNFLPLYDGDEIVECIYVSRRRTSELKRAYPALASKISEDPGMYHPQGGIDPLRFGAAGQTTILDWFSRDGGYARLMGGAFQTVDLGYGFDSVPFIDFPCYSLGSQEEPLNSIDQIVELNQYLDQLVSQKADIIRKYSNPTILDEQSGQSPEAIRAAVSADGSVLPVRRDGNIRFLNWEGQTPAIDEQVTLILDAMFDISGKPRASFGQTITNQSGVMTNLSLTPTVQSNEDHETTWGSRLSKLNEWVLRLWETFSKSEEIKFRGVRPRGQIGNAVNYFEVNLKGSEIGGWYKNRIKWPSAIRVDDPVYVQNILSQLTSDPPSMSLYSALESLGREDVEAEIDRISRQLEDPRFHPDRLTAMTGAIGELQSSMDPAAQSMLGGMSGGSPEPSVDGTPQDPAVVNQQLGAGGSPYADQLSANITPGN